MANHQILYNKVDKYVFKDRKIIPTLNGFWTFNTYLIFIEIDAQNLMPKYTFLIKFGIALACDKKYLSGNIW